MMIKYTRTALCTIQKVRKTIMANNWTLNEKGNIVFPVPETVKIPWDKSRGELPLTVEYFNGTMYEKVEETAKKHPLMIALDFMGKHITYKYMIDQINLCAKSLRVLGIRENDRVTIAMPNCPQAIYMLYAINLVGAVANMVHPLSAEKEIENYQGRADETYQGRLHADRRPQDTEDP